MAGIGRRAAWRLIYNIKTAFWKATSSAGPTSMILRDLESDGFPMRAARQGIRWSIARLIADVARHAGRGIHEHEWRISDDRPSVRGRAIGVDVELEIYPAFETVLKGFHGEIAAASAGRFHGGTYSDQGTLLFR